MPVILAHGSLGAFDEVIMLGVAAVFLIMMGISWVKSRNSTITFEEDSPEPELPTRDEGDSAGRFKLE